MSLLTAGCKVIAIGDSNTCAKFYGDSSCAADGKWPELLQRSLWWRGWRVINRGVPGMTAGRYYESDRDVRTRTDEYAFAAWHVEKLLVEQHLARACRGLVVARFAPIVVIALGTNDVIYSARDNTADGRVASDILGLARRIEAVAPCIRVYIALIPPVRQAILAARIERENEILRARVPAARLIDLYTGFGVQDLQQDGVHMIAKAQEQRAEVVRRTIWNVGPPRAVSDVTNTPVSARAAPSSGTSSISR